jgi:5-formyltetrahydrofolate cyclo-ligase
MSESIPEQKAELRRRIRCELKRLSPAVRLAASSQICSRLQEQPTWREARSVLLFAPLHDEVDIVPLFRDALAAGKRLALPRFDHKTQSYVAGRVVNPGNDLEPGRFGISEPAENCAEVPLNELDFLVVPGVAFTLDGRRLGRGKAYYDRLLACVRGLTCGVAFDEQIVNAIPAEPHDIRLDLILTPSRWHRAGQSAVWK